MRNNQLLKIFYVMLLSICFAISGNQYVCANDNPAANKPTSSTREPTPDEVDEVMQAAKAAIESTDQNIKTKNGEILSLITKMKDLLDQSIREDAAIAEKIKSSLATPDPDKLAERLEKMNGMKAFLIDQINRKQRIVTAMEAAAAEAAKAREEVEDWQKARPCFALISQNSAYANQFLSVPIGDNARQPVEQFLKTYSSCKCDVIEVKNTNGFKVVFRVGKLTHCLSTKQQCGGKAYSVTK